MLERRSTLDRLSKLQRVSVLRDGRWAPLNAESAANKISQGPIVYKTGSFLVPNEMSPTQMVPITSAAMTGVYVGVGTERCWLAGALNPQLTALYMADRDPQVATYNAINATLIAAAHGSRSAYKHLRLHTSQRQWTEAARTLPEGQAKLLSNPQAHTFWTLSARNSAMQMFDQKRGDFAHANYMHHDALYARVDALVRNDKVFIGQLQLHETKDARALLQSLESQTISLLDVSNAWHPAYMGMEGFKGLLNTLKPALNEQSLVLGTSLRLRTVCHRFSRRTEARFSYFGLHAGSALQRWTATRNYLLSMANHGHKDSDVNTIDAHLKNDTYALEGNANGRSPTPVPMRAATLVHTTRLARRVASQR